MKLCNAFLTVRPMSFPNFHRPIKPSVCISSTPNSESTHRAILAETLQSETLQILEWPSVCNQVSAFTTTTMGFAAASNGRLPLGRSPEESRKLLALTAAAVALPRGLDFSGIEDVSGVVDCSVSGELVSIGELCRLKRTLSSARKLLEQLEEIALDADSSDRFSPLLEILQGCNFLSELEQKIGFCIDCKFSIILDRASEDLEIIRLERKKNMENLESLLKQASAQIFQAGGIDRPLVTMRRSRMCIGVRASHRSLLPDGVVLDTSSSGATYFMEPKEAVDLNNMEVRLSNFEKNEEQAILSLLTSEIAEFKTEISYLLDKILEVDLALARAAHARWMNGVCPLLTSGDSGGIHSNLTDPHVLLDIEGIQHPLLLETSLRSLSALVASKSSGAICFNEPNNMLNTSISGSSDFPVPIDFKVACGTKIIVISGPNTGGKTASMKTLGLASVMLKAGMYLPARNCPKLPWFDLILADIGDRQSLEQNLSTFSGHIACLCKILEVATEDSLVLIDEIGSGTDPSEGVALSTSILQYLKERVNLAVVTTHYADLTRLKDNDGRFENAAVEFSLETLQPTYRVLWGSMGQSNALNIARSIGFSKEIIERAQSWVEKLTPEKLQKHNSLLFQSLIEERSRLEAQASISASLQSDVMDLYNEIRDEAEDLDERVAALKAKETQKIQREIKAAKAQIQKVLEEFEHRVKTAGPDLYNSLLQESVSAISSIVEEHCPIADSSVQETKRNSYTPQLGEQVYVKGLGNKLATVVEAPGSDGTVLVQYGKIRVRVKLSSLGALVDSDKNGISGPVSRLRRQVQHSRNYRKPVEANRGEDVSYGPVLQTSKNTLDLRGMRVEEASHHLDMAIAARGSNSVLFIIHGMGTGVVKERTHEILRNHPRVAKFELESPMNYGCTVAYIK